MLRLLWDPECASAACQIPDDPSASKTSSKDWVGWAWKLGYVCVCVRACIKSMDQDCTLKQWWVKNDWIIMVALSVASIWVSSLQFLGGFENETGPSPRNRIMALLNTSLVASTPRSPMPQERDWVMRKISLFDTFWCILSLLNLKEKCRVVNTCEHIQNFCVGLALLHFNFMTQVMHPDLQAKFCCLRLNRLWWWKKEEEMGFFWSGQCCTNRYECNAYTVPGQHRFFF